MSGPVDRQSADRRASERMALYLHGLSDSEIAAKLHLSPDAIRKWRGLKGLRPNSLTYQPFTEEDEQDRLRLYQQGLSDKAIAAKLGRNKEAIRQWRIKRKLPRHQFKTSLLTSEQQTRRMLFYQLGWNDIQIAQEIGAIDSSTIYCWRKRNRLPENFSRNGSRKSRRTPTLADVMARIRKAIGHALPSDILDDTVSDIALAILDGTISLTEIEAQARKFGNRVLSQYASRWGPRSIDETIAGTEDLRMVDLIADERSSSWLEEMGATVW